MATKGFLKMIPLSICQNCHGVVEHVEDGPSLCTSCGEVDPKTEDMDPYEYEQSQKIQDQFDEKEGA